eukprot:GHVQ01035790.1.p1 GENE.GHVQ01035790.1~~GHVQ01035790.1.p1  ORF type:complete len:455 (-),score=22.19 GHVQ01035790.1:4490-5854(-)
MAQHWLFRSSLAQTLTVSRSPVLIYSSLIVSATAVAALSFYATYRTFRTFAKRFYLYVDESELPQTDLPSGGCLGDAVCGEDSSYCGEHCRQGHVDYCLTASVDRKRTKPCVDSDSIDITDVENISNSFQESRPTRVLVQQKRLSKREGIPKSVGFRDSSANDSIAEFQTCIPGSQSVYVKTFGCSHNTSDAEFMMGQLSAYGFKLVDNMEEADACVVNSCTVKNPSQDAFMTTVRKAKELRKALIVSGCVPQADRNLSGLEDISVIGVTQTDRVVEVVEQTLAGNVVRLLGKKSLPSLDLPKIRRNPLVEIIPLSTGCLGSCTYCKTKHARGKLGSYDPEAILQRATQAVTEGIQQIWLTSEDTGAYGLDINTDIVTLLRKLVARVPAGVMIRLGMTNPPYMMDHIDAIGEILQLPQVFEFLHVPVQSGSDNTLKHMVRGGITLVLFALIFDT